MASSFPDDSHTYPWYGLVPAEEKLEQGDYLRDFPVFLPPITVATGHEEAQAGTRLEEFIRVRVYDVTILTQSCDLLDAPDGSSIVVCPCYALSEAKTPTGKSLNNADGWGKLIRGSFVGLHLLNRCTIPGYEFEYQVVDLQQVYTAPYALVKAVASRHDLRVRLLPPYREHLSQSFARQFMRVGLPINLPTKFPPPAD